MLSWLFDLVPWWIWLVGAIVLAGATYQFWGWLWALAPNWLKITFGAVGGAILIYLKGRSDKASEQKKSQAERNAEARQKRQEVDDEIRNTSDDDLHKRTSRWMRDK